MADLILKFFQENLTEAEEQALGEKLLSSTEDALRFGEEAEKAYLSFGLPEPKWPGGGGSAPPWPSALGLKTFLLLSFIMTSGAAGWALWHSHLKMISAVPTTLPVERPVISTKPAVSKILPSTIHVPKETVKAPGIPAPAAAPSHPSLTPITAVLTPVDLLTSPRKNFSNLSVVVRRPSPGEVTVRVLKPDGTPAVLLYQGLLKAGKWGFDWDGRLAGGQLAPPGYYQIQVQSGPIVQKKSILIR